MTHSFVLQYVLRKRLRLCRRGFQECPSSTPDGWWTQLTYSVVTSNDEGSRAHHASWTVSSDCLRFSHETTMIKARWNCDI